MTNDKTSYANAYRNINFREHPEKYRIGRGEQGVLIAEPYKSELLPHWKFATPGDALQSAAKIYSMFEEYGARNDFVGMDMARKFLQMGFTRARRYANHPSGRKYDEQHRVTQQDTQWQTSQKAASATIFLEYYRRAMANEHYLTLKKLHQAATRKKS
ncbi:MAG TPA: DUF4385 domain-containing protein [Candidatus Saccharimonadales bacterium]|nr:DUF4385 domain-containing protein [Candidatus Saccharimonadales bacterium]